MRRLHRALFGCLLFGAAALIVILVEAREDEILLLVAAPMPASLFAGLLPYWLFWKSPLREQMLWSDLSLSGSAVALGNFALPRFLGCACLLYTSIGLQWVVDGTRKHKLKFCNTSVSYTHLLRSSKK